MQLSTPFKIFLSIIGFFILIIVFVGLSSIGKNSFTSVEPKQTISAPPIDEQRQVIKKLMSDCIQSVDLAGEYILNVASDLEDLRRGKPMYQVADSIESNIAMSLLHLENAKEIDFTKINDEEKRNQADNLAVELIFERLLQLQFAQELFLFVDGQLDAEPQFDIEKSNERLASVKNKISDFVAGVH